MHAMEQQASKVADLHYVVRVIMSVALINDAVFALATTMTLRKDHLACHKLM